MTGTETLGAALALAAIPIVVVLAVWVAVRLDRAVVQAFSDDKGMFRADPGPDPPPIPPNLCGVCGRTFGPGEGSDLPNVCGRCRHQEVMAHIREAGEARRGR